MRLQKKTGIKWVADFRDPWTLEHVISETQTGIVHNFDDEAKMIKTIKDLFDEYLKGEAYTQKGHPDKFSRREIAGNLAELLYNI
jgi:hypothetical protein